MNAKKKPNRKPTAHPARASGSDELRRIKDILELMEAHGLQELEIGADGRSLRVSKNTAGVPMMPMPAAAPAPAHAPAAAGGPEVPAPAEDAGLEKFLSPMVGTFYRAASPENPPYVVEGDKVTEDSLLCLIEAMKVFNEIKAEMSGTIVEALVENGEAVEYGQPLFLIRKSS